MNRFRKSKLVTQMSDFSSGVLLSGLFNLLLAIIFDEPFLALTAIILLLIGTYLYKKSLRISGIYEYSLECYNYLDNILNQSRVRSEWDLFDKEFKRLVLDGTFITLKYPHKFKYLLQKSEIILSRLES